jgi:hypothetical protein
MSLICSSLHPTTYIQESCTHDIGHFMRICHTIAEIPLSCHSIHEIPLRGQTKVYPPQRISRIQPHHQASQHLHHQLTFLKLRSLALQTCSHQHTHPYLNKANPPLPSHTISHSSPTTSHTTHPCTPATASKRPPKRRSRRRAIIRLL